MISKPPHYRQLIVPEWQIVHELALPSFIFKNNILYCIINGPEDEEYRLRLYMAASYLYQLSRLVYKSKGEYKKLPVNMYKTGLFFCLLDNDERLTDKMKSVSKQSADIEMVKRCINRIGKIASGWISSLADQFSAGEYAYLIDHVIQRKGEIPLTEEGFFPENYADFSPKSKHQFSTWD